MTRLWIGDFRLQQIQNMDNIFIYEEEKNPIPEGDEDDTQEDSTPEEDTEDESSEEDDSTEESILLETEEIFLVADDAEYSWFSTTVLAQLPLMSLYNTVAIISLGFNDCVRSCLWGNTFKVQEIAENYAEKINELITSYPDISFYVCAVNPVARKYPFNGEVIGKSTLNNKIKEFNEKLAEKCEAHFIDSFSYLQDSGFKTRDGVRLTVESCKELREYILSQVMFTVLVSFTQRAWAELDKDGKVKKENGKEIIHKNPPRESDGESFLYWKTKASGGYSDCIEVHAGTGCTLPNCVGYAYGRFMEIMQSSTTTLNNGAQENAPSVELSAGNAKVWFGNTDDGYERSDKDKPSEAVPKPGAVMCWDHSDASRGGHVAIVEQVLNDGSVITSESGWNDARPVYNPDSGHFYSNHRHRGSDGNWGQSKSNGYTFQGFIYNPAVTFTGSSTDYVSKSQVTSNNDSLSETEQQLNARYIWQYLGSKGWTLNAVAAMLGNMQNESSINPGKYEYYTYNSSSDMYLGPNPTQEEINDYLEKYKSKKGRYPGYGLTQWTSTDISSWSEHKYIKWCNQRNLDPTDIDSALLRLEYEVEAKVQWYGYDQDRADYPITFQEFTKSTKDVEWLAACFLLRYEVPGDRYDAVEGRQNNARKWFEFLLPYAPGMGVSLGIHNLKTKDKSPTEVEASFIVRNWEKYEYVLTDSAGQEIARYSEENPDRKEPEEDDDTEDNASESDPTDSENTTATDKIDPTMLGKVIYKTLSNLKPNSRYTLTVKAFGSSESDEVESTTVFTTKQDYPGSVGTITLTPADEKLPYELFRLDVEEPDYWGYWRKNDHGYTVQLWVDGKIKNEFTTGSIGLAAIRNLLLPLVFPLYSSKIADTVQIGIRTWVKDDDGEYIYDSDSAKASNTVCFLKQPFLHYLNTE